MPTFDAAVIGGGHNGLLAATLLARAGLSVVLLERLDRVGGAAVSDSPWPGVDVRISRYAYLVSLFPAALRRELGLDVELRRRRIASYTPHRRSGLLIEGADERRWRGDVAIARADAAGWDRLHAMLGRVAQRVFPTLLEPLRPREDVRRLIDDDEAWRSLFEEPLSALLERTLSSDLLRGIVLTDATIGTFASAGDPLLRQNRCFLYHVTGNGTGRWDVPVGGMGALSDGLHAAARRAGVEIRTATEAVSLSTDGMLAEVHCAEGAPVLARHVLVGAAPAVLKRLLGGSDGGDVPEGSQLKINMLLSRLPRLHDPSVTPEDAFSGTFHVNEGYDQIETAFAQASAGEIPVLPPLELYCHSLSDPTILSTELRERGAHTLTAFTLHMPARLFTSAQPDTKRVALAATLRSLNSVLADPIEECLWRTSDGEPCLEAVTPPELEAELSMPGGHIFHRDLAWPFAESEREVGLWGTETEHRNIWLCGAGARRGGGVSGIAGHNGARAVLRAMETLPM